MSATELDPAFGNWLAGFIDGEGCFCIRSHTNQGYNRTTYYSCQFSVALRADDSPILWEICERTGIGAIDAKCRTNANPKTVWRVNRKADCATLIEILDRFSLRAKKARDYALWRQAVEIWQTAGGRGGAPGLRGQRTFDWTQIKVLRDEMMASRAYA